jgi:hypothetical protein
MTFDQLCGDISPEMRDQMAFHLAMLRFKTTYEGLRQCPLSAPTIAPVPVARTQPKRSATLARTARISALKDQNR